MLLSAATACVMAWGITVPASAGTTRPAAPARVNASGSLGNYQISGIEDAIGCLTAHRCVAVGYRGGSAPAQVVLVVGGRQLRVSTVRSSSNLFAVSCPNRFGCWALGAPRTGTRNYVLVKISPTGTVRSEIRVRVQGGASLAAISCGNLTSCEIFGRTITPEGLNNWYFLALSGGKLSQAYKVGGSDSYDYPGGISCWQVTCVAVGTWVDAGSGRASRDQSITTVNGIPGSVSISRGRGYSGVSCVSSSTCYATTNNATVVTLTSGVPGTPENLPLGAASIECAGSTCWAVAWTGSGAAFEAITSGLPTGSPVSDSALMLRTRSQAAAITRRGSGFAIVGAPAISKPRITEVVTD